MERVADKIVNKTRRAFIKPWQKETPVLLAISKVLEIIGAQDTHPRLAHAAFIDIFKEDEVLDVYQELSKNPALPVVLLDISAGRNRSYMDRKNPWLIDIAQFPNVRAIDSLQLVANVLTLYDNPRTALFPQNIVMDILETARSSIKHDLRYALSDSERFNKAQLIERGRKELGLEGSDEEVAAVIMSEHAPLAVKKQLNISGIFVDWEGTLYQKNDVNKAVLEKAKKQAQSQQLPLSVWTGGNVDEAYKILHKNGLDELDVCSKQDCFGLKVAQAIDDEPLEKLHQYGIAVEAFEHLAVK